MHDYKTYYDDTLHDEILIASEIILVKEAKPLKEYKLLLTFTNEEQRIFDFAPQLQSPLLAPLKDENLFKRVKVVGGSIAWSDDLDYCPDSLYRDSIPLQDTELS